MMHLIDSAKGALKLCLLHMQHPSAVDVAQVQATANEAIERLNLIATKNQLEETYSAVRAVIPQNLRVAVAPSSSEKHPVDVFIFDRDDLIDIFTGRTPAGIAEFLRLKFTEAA